MRKKYSFLLFNHLQMTIRKGAKSQRNLFQKSPVSFDQSLVPGGQTCMRLIHFLERLSPRSDRHAWRVHSPGWLVLSRGVGGERRFERGWGVGEEAKVEHLRRGFLEGGYDGSWRYALRAVMLLGHHRTISEATSLPYARRNSRHVSCYISASASPD